MPCEVNSNADSEFDLRAGGFYTRLVFTLTVVRGLIAFIIYPNLINYHDNSTDMGRKYHNLRLVAIISLANHIFQGYPYRVYSSMGCFNGPPIRYKFTI